MSSWVCIAGNCDGCQFADVCGQEAPYIETHLEEIVEATILKIKCCVYGLKKYMRENGYAKLDDIRGNVNNTWLKGVL